MDLSQLAKSTQKETFTFELVRPDNGEPLGVMLSVIGAQSDQAQAYMAKQIRKEQLRELENAKSRKPKVKELSEMQQESREMAINRLAGWQNVEWNGKPLDFSEENARLLLTECPWIADQIFEHSNDLGKFLAS